MNRLLWIRALLDLALSFLAALCAGVLAYIALGWRPWTLPFMATTVLTFAAFNVAFAWASRAPKGGR